MNEEPLQRPEDEDNVHPEQTQLPVDPDRQPDPLPADSPPVEGTPSRLQPGEEPETGDYPPAKEGQPDTAAPPE